MRTLYELCERAERCAREGDKRGAAAALAEAHVFIQPEVKLARMRLETKTLYGYLSTLYRAAQTCNAWLHPGLPLPDLDFGGFMPSPSANLRGFCGSGHRSSLDFRWNKWRERAERWADVACRCPSL